MLYTDIDGQLVDSTSTTVISIVFSNNDPHKIGAETSSNQSTINYFNGDISNLAFFDYPLSQQEIQDFMTCPPTGSELGIVGSWNFEEGRTINDQTAVSEIMVTNGAAYDTNVPTQSCQLVNSNGCDSCIAMLKSNNNSGDTIH